MARRYAEKGPLRPGRAHITRLAGGADPSMLAQERDGEFKDS
jgi:hypothetical protein